MSAEQQGGNQTAGQIPKTSGLAIASLVLGIISIVMIWSGWIALICALLAVIFGAVALKQISASQGKLGGKGMATAGLVLGIIILSIAILVIIACGACFIWSTKSIEGLTYY